MNTHSALHNAPRALSRILCINYNQDQGCFAVGHEEGFLVYNTNPIDLRVNRHFSGGRNGLPRIDDTGLALSIHSLLPPRGSGSFGTASGIGHITMLHRTNYLALVGGGANPKAPSEKLIIWDDLKRKNSLTLEFASPVVNVLLSRVRIIVVLRTQVYVYGFEAPPKKFASYDTIDNEFGLADLSVNASTSNGKGGSPGIGSSSKFQTLAFPGKLVGQIQIVDVSTSVLEKSTVSIIKAHKLKIRCLALNRLGTLVASASETGTLIRVHSTHNNALVFEFRRGIDRAVIQSMKFSHNDSRLAVLLDKHTIHVFSLLVDHEANKRHILRNLLLPVPIPQYFHSTWSFCLVNTSKYSDGRDDEGVLGWSGNDTVIVVWKEKKIWEKYVIADAGDDGWKLEREGWKTLSELA